jgi:hypothetical protein
VTVWRLLIVLMLMLPLSIPAPASAHGTAKIKHHRIQRLDGAVRTFGTYRTSQRHARISVTAFLIQNERIIAEKTRRCRSTVGCQIQLRVDCRRTAPVYAVIQGNTRKGGHFATWNSRRVVCTR